MPFDEEKILQDYIARLLSLQDERDEWLGEDDLKKAARDLGLSDRDLARIDAVAEGHRQRGHNFSRHEAWDEAIAEFRQAMVLDPFDVPLLHELAVAHASRYQQTHRDDDRAAARHYARRCIQLDADHQRSYELLTALQQAPAAHPGKRAKVAVFVAAAVVLVGALLVLVTLDTAPSTPPPTPPDGPLPSEASIPIRLVEDGNAEGLRLSVEQSLFKNYDASFSYTLNATLHNEAHELHRLRMKLALIGAAGEVLQTKYFDAVADHEPYLRPGDTAPLDALIYEKQAPPGVREALLSVDIVERMPAPDDYGAPRPVPLTWAFTQPAYLDVAVFERESRISRSLREDLHFLTLALRNQGSRAVQGLRLKVTWYGPQDEVLTSKLSYAVLSSGPALRPGETWVDRVIGTFPQGSGQPFARYAVSVVEAE